MVIGGSAHINEAYIMPMHKIIDDIKLVTRKEEVAVAKTTERFWQSGGVSAVGLQASQRVLLPRGKVVLAPVHPDPLTRKSSDGVFRDKALMPEGALATAPDNGSQALQQHPSRLQVGGETSVGTAKSARYLDQPSSDSYTRISSSVGYLGFPRNMPWRMSNYLNDQSDARFARMFGRGSSVTQQQSLSGVLLSDDASRLSMNTSMLLCEESLPTTCRNIGNQAIILASSRPDMSFASSIGCRAMENGTSKLRDGMGSEVLPSRESKSLECPFIRIFNCLRTYSNEKEWICHSLTHLKFHGRNVEPPTSNRCRFCEKDFYSLTPYQSWVEMMSHLSLHHALGYDLSQARPDYSLLKYLFDHRIVSDAEYRHLKSSLINIDTPTFSYVSKDCISISKGRRGRQGRQGSTCGRPNLGRTHQLTVHNEGTTPVHFSPLTLAEDLALPRNSEIFSSQSSNSNHYSQDIPLSLCTPIPR